MIIGDEFYDVLFQCFFCRECCCVPHGIFSPVGVSAMAFGKPANVRNGIVENLALH